MATKLLNKRREIGVVLGVKQAYEPQKIINTALDGTVYVQTTGKATDKKQVDVYCSTVERRNALDTASNEGALLTIDNWRGSRLLGFIEKTVTWKEWKDGHGVGRFTYIVDETEEVD